MFVEKIKNFILIYILYGTISFFLSVIYLVLSLFYPKLRYRLRERLGFWDLKSNEKPIIWFHGASLGESKGTINLVKKLSLGSYYTIATATSNTGYESLKNSKLFDQVFMLPLDNLFSIFLATRGLKVKYLLIAETEIWPNLIFRASKLKAKLFYFNAKISSKTFRTYEKLKFLFAPVLRKVDKFYCISNDDQLKITQLGGLNAIVCGSTKYEGSAYSQLDKISEKESRGLNPNLPVLVLGSIREEEEKVALEVANYFFNKKVTVVIAPRYPERFDLFSNSLTIKHSRVSLVGGDHSVHTNIILLDTVGELNSYYKAADIAFVGGSINSKAGGHNILEPAQFGAVLLFGSCDYNFLQESKELEESGGLVRVNSAKEIIDSVQMFLTNAEELKKASSANLEVWNKLSGASTFIKGDLSNVL